MSWGNPNLMMSHEVVKQYIFLLIKNIMTGKGRLQYEKQIDLIP